MKALKQGVLIFALLATAIAGCKKEVPEVIGGEEGNNQAPITTQRINEFFETAMKDVYLWYNEIPNIDLKYEFDSKAYFEKLKYEEDKWSFVTDDVEGLNNSLEGKETSFGWSLAPGKFTDSENRFALVEYVYPNTPAAAAGMKRGDFIYQINGGSITANNYIDLIYGPDISITYGEYTESGISNTKTVSMTAKELELDPVLLTKIIEAEGKKIGYLFYASFIGKYNTSIDTALMYLRDEGATDLILDLRYNGGGGTSPTQHLCSSLAPLSAVENNSTLVTFQWNDKYQKYWQEQNVMSQLVIPMINTVPVKMDLTDLHVITGNGTASASEFLITGLKPYLNLTTYGETTYGKYTAWISLTPEDIYDNASYYSDFKNWGVQPTVLRYANSLGVTDFKDGFAPDFPVDDDLFSSIQLGDKKEAILSVVLENITGVAAPPSNKSAKIKVPYELYDIKSSKFEDYKNSLRIDNFDMDLLKLK